MSKDLSYPGNGYIYKGQFFPRSFAAYETPSRIVSAVLALVFVL